MTRAMFALLLAGCFSKPGLADDEGGECTIVPNATSGMVVEGARSMRWPEGMSIRFGDPSIQVPQPSHLGFDTTTNLIALSMGCVVPDGVGMGSYPLFLASANTDRLFENVHIDTLVSGPAYIEMGVRWERPFTCATSSDGAHATGETHWGLFPDGRIVRVDAMIASSIDVVLANCDACYGGVNVYELTSYFAFMRDALATFAPLPSTTEVAVPAPGEPTSMEPGGCLTTAAGKRLALRFDRFDSTPRAHWWSATNDEEVLVFSADLFSSGPSSQIATIPQSAHGVRTTLLMDATGARSCADLQQATHELTEQQPMLLASSGNLERIPIAFDDLERYTAEERFGSTTTMTSADGVVRGGFLISIQMPGTRIKTSRDAARVIWHHDDASGRFYIWFRDPLPANETITLTSC